MKTNLIEIDWTDCNQRAKEIFERETRCLPGPEEGFREFQVMLETPSQRSTLFRMLFVFCAIFKEIGEDELAVHTRRMASCLCIGIAEVTKKPKRKRR